MDVLEMRNYLEKVGQLHAVHEFENRFTVVPMLRLRIRFTLLIIRSLSVGSLSLEHTV